MPEYSDWFNGGSQTEPVGVSVEYVKGMVPPRVETGAVERPARGTATFSTVPGKISGAGEMASVGTVFSRLSFSTFILNHPTEDPYEAAVSVGMGQAQITAATLESAAPTSGPTDDANIPEGWNPAFVSVEFEEGYAGTAELGLTCTFQAFDAYGGGGGGRDDRDSWGRLYWSTGTLTPSGSFYQYPGDGWRGWTYSELADEATEDIDIPIAADTPMLLFPAAESIIAAWTASPFSSLPSGSTSYSTQAQINFVSGYARFNYPRYRFVYDPPSTGAFGMWNTRQRQTLAGNVGGFPLRQRGNGNATGAWSLRQRQAGN